MTNSDKGLVSAGQDRGVAADAAGLSPSVEPVPVSPPDGASIPNAQHTPGPWEARRAARPDNTGGYDWAIVAPGKAIIAECFEHVDWREQGVFYDVRPAEANATLIAAAPDLLEALVMCEVMVVDSLNSHLGEGCWDDTEISADGGFYLSDVRAAIAKAEGR